MKKDWMTPELEVLDINMTKGAGNNLICSIFPSFPGCGGGGNSGGDLGS